MSGFGALVWIPVGAVAVVAALALAMSLAWRRVAPRFDARLAGDGLAPRVMRDGVAAGFALVGVGIALTGVGYLGHLSSVSARAGSDGAGSDAPLAVLSNALPVSDLGVATLVVGFGFVLGALLVSVGVDLRRRLDRES